MKINLNSKKVIFASSFFIAVVFLATFSLWKALFFNFWRDDWGDTWEVIYHAHDYITTSAAIRLHPGLGLEIYLLGQVFRTNPFPWQITGILLRIGCSFSVALMMLGVTKSKKIALISGIFFAPLLTGLESYVWISAHTSGLFLLFFCVGVYFWTLGLYTKKLLHNILAILILVPSFAVTPARGIVMLGLLPLWDFLMLVVSPSKKALVYSVIRTIVLLVCVLSVFHVLNASGTFNTSSIHSKIIETFYNGNLIKNFLASVGNGTIGWFIPIFESGSLANPDTISIIGGIVLCLFVVFSLIGFLLKRTTSFAIFLFFSVWMIVFYLPNWLFDQNLTIGASHRYLTASSVGLVGIFAYLFGSIKQKWFIIPVFLFIICNVMATQRVLTEQSMYRSTTIVNYIWDKINNDVPKGQKGQIFMYEGSDNLRGSVLDWSGVAPFALRRKIVDQEDFPVPTGDRKLILQLLCLDNVQRPALGPWIVQRKKIPLSHLYAWDVSNRVITNVSKKERASFASASNPQEADCSGVTPVAK